MTSVYHDLDQSPTSQRIECRRGFQFSFKPEQSEDDSKKPYCVRSFDDRTNPVSTLRTKQELTEKFDQQAKGAESEIGVKRREENDGDSCATQLTGSDCSSVSNATADVEVAESTVMSTYPQAHMRSGRRRGDWGSLPDLLFLTSDLYLNSYSTVTRQHKTPQQPHKGRRSVSDVILPGHWRAHWWIPARTPTVHQCPQRGEALGGPLSPSPRDV